MVAAPGVEMLLGMFRDEQFGPVVVLGFGGVHVEALADVVYACRRSAPRKPGVWWIGSSCVPARQPPARARTGDRRILRRGGAILGVVAGLADTVGEIDLNPVIVHADGCTIVDALIVGRQGAGADRPNMRQAV